MSTTSNVLSEDHSLLWLISLYGLRLVFMVVSCYNALPKVLTENQMLYYLSRCCDCPVKEVKPLLSFIQANCPSMLEMLRPSGGWINFEFEFELPGAHCKESSSQIGWFCAVFARFSRVWLSRLDSEGLQVCAEPASDWDPAKTIMLRGHSVARCQYNAVYIYTFIEYSLYNYYNTSQHILSAIFSAPIQMYASPQCMTSGGFIQCYRH